ncbi:hypothetical protein VIGAN_07166200 [Vigna angularis var. angularis]|uniref:Uncharacterized protein n=1 Tax=Vigna angularis var. angularis TaxID=157739 RepID=A0A0S3SIZ9_PHAAN|nr:membrin-11 [Vigna angularis]BAT92819.1 hypothetical protein VIGAN_07166200 [Vigna angularis var. angularis]
MLELRLSQIVVQIAEEAESLRASLDKYNLRHQKRMREANERAELLGRANGDFAHVLRIFHEEAQALHSVRASAPELENASAIGEANPFFNKWSKENA